MKMRFLVSTLLSPILLVAISAIFPVQSATAQSSSTQTDELRAELAALRARVQRLERQLSEQRSERGADEVLQAPFLAASGLVELVAPTAPVAPGATAERAKPTPQISWRAAPEVKSADGWSFKPRGRFLFDGAYVLAPAAISDEGLGFSNEVRRVRLGAQGKIPGGFGYKIEADFAGGDVALADAFLNYQAGPVKITLGHQNTFQSLEELSSSNDTSFIERAAFTDAFSYEHRLGISTQYSKGAFLLQVGVFTDNFGDLQNDENNAISFDGRFVIAPQLGGTRLHFGGSVHWRDVGDSATTTRYRQRPLVHSSDVRFISTPRFEVQNESDFGLEAAVIAGRFHAAAEAQWRIVDLPGDKAGFFGSAIEAGIFLTDDSRGYKNGVFKGVKVRKPLGQGGFGALQFNLRYDYLDLTDADAGIVGGTQNGYMASLIWTPVNYVRFMVNYGRLEYRGAFIAAGDKRDYGVDSFGTRAQIAF